ncbi:M48 family metalloprotease [Sulfitobacter sabulilitoris]|uniref:Tetratricopeptide repeat protein n=1 Tax=Sulfitobacter sabulilitoris TaxID=2562655 RepID=A0A5S3PJ39_9RHOB|nr:M48 family metalloprotease [Sulfitobacter sabulilitoris]TMM54409.1 tetratricopeptide repeat protein [Sulfitobacter sabulilitoris]
MTFHRVFPLASIPALLLALIVTMGATQGARAAGLLRDADLEHGLEQVGAPVLRAAGLNPARVKILVVNDSTLNAFVVGNDAIFIHYGLINRMDTAAMLQAVIAHEAAHIANGHITRRMTNMANSRTISGLGMALAAVAAASGNGRAAAGVALGSAGSAQRAFLGHTRAEEASADQSGVRYMTAAGVDAQGLRDVLDLFRGQELLAETRQDPYLRSHPLSRDRLRAVEAYAAAYGRKAGPDPAAAYWFARVKGKLSAYTRAPKWTLRRLGDSPYADVRLLREAVAEHRQSRTKQALGAIDRAIAVRPGDPFLHDMRGQILIETRNFGAAVAAYGRAAQLAPGDPLILSGYGRALLAAGQVGKALPVLERARSIDFRDGSMLRDLSVAYAKTGQTGLAALVTAERYALSGRLEDAGIHARRASGLLPRGSGPWQRAQDVVSASERAAKRR